MRRESLPLTEMIAAVLSDGAARKRNSISSALENRFTSDQIEAALRKLNQDGRVTRVRSGYYAIVSPFEQPLDTTGTLSDPAFDIIRRYARAPTTFEMLARSRFVPRASLWKCLSVLVQRGELDMIAGGIEEGGVRFQAKVSKETEKGSAEAPAFDLSDTLNSGAIFRMSDLEKSTGLSSRMLLNRLQNFIREGRVHSFQLRSRRYLVGMPSKPVGPLSIRLQSQPQPIIGKAEFDPQLIDFLRDLHRCASSESGGPLEAFSKTALVPALIRSGIISAEDAASPAVQLTSCGFALIEALSRPPVDGRPNSA